MYKQTIKSPNDKLKTKPTDGQHKKTHGRGPTKSTQDENTWTNTCIQRKEEEDTRRTPRHRLHASTDQSFSPEIHLVGAATDTGNLPGPESPSTKTPVSDHTPSFLCSKCCRASIAYRDLIQTFCHKPKTKEVYPDQKH